MRRVSEYGWKVTDRISLGAVSPCITASSPDNKVGAFLADGNGPTVSVYTFNWAKAQLKRVAVRSLPKSVHASDVTWLLACGNDGSVCCGYTVYGGPIGPTVWLKPGGSAQYVGKYHDLYSNDKGIFGAAVGPRGSICIHTIEPAVPGSVPDFVIPNPFRHGIANIACSDDDNYWVVEENHWDKIQGTTLEALFDIPWTNLYHLKLAVWNRPSARMSRSYDLTSCGTMDFVPLNVMQTLPAR
jgi:hypothetical protein